MQQNNGENDLSCTILLPENATPGPFPAPAAEAAEVPTGTPAGKSVSGSGSTMVNSVLDRIFSQEEQPAVEALSLQADPSLEFRSKLELSGNKYRIEKVVATGGFGRIFQAEDRVLGRKAIVKTLKEEHLQDEKAIEHFIAEAKLNSQLDHPGIVPLFSLDTDTNNGLHLAMQKITGITLKVYLERCRTLQLQEHYPQKLYNRMLTERLEIFLRICDTIAYCHDRGVLHNDLKPNNVMIGRYGQVYVMDWGAATLATAPKPQHDVGTPSYMAPERLCARVLSRETDIFALGMILNELATLRPPIERGSMTEVIECICTGQFEPSTCIDPGRNVSMILRAIIEKARDPNPQKRYASIQDLSADVRHFLLHEETAAYPDSMLQKAFRFLFHHRRIAISFAGSLLALLIAAVGYNFYNAAAITRKAGEETLWKLHQLQSVDRKSTAIGKQLLLLQEQTANMGSALAIELGKKLYDTNARIYWNEDFAPKSKKRPPGLIHTVAHRGKPITLSVGTFYRFRKQIPEQEIQDWANNFRAQQSQHMANVLSHIRSGDGTYKSDKLKLFYERGSTVQRIICVLDNGLVYCYPGQYEPAVSPEAFIPEFVRRELRSGKSFAWSSPSMDAVSGKIVVSSWHNISTLRGNRVGVIGMVSIYDDLLKEFLELVRLDPEPAVYTLVDADARLLCVTASGAVSPEKFSVSTTESMIGHHSYKWYSEVIRRIRNNPAKNQFTATLSGKRFNITWKTVPSSNWLLIQHIPLDGRKKKRLRFQLPAENAGNSRPGSTAL